jgi:hypothetical protein
MLGKRPWTTTQLVTSKPVCSKRHFRIERKSMRVTCRRAYSMSSSSYHKQATKEAEGARTEEAAADGAEEE